MVVFTETQIGEEGDKNENNNNETKGGDKNSDETKENKENEKNNNETIVDIHGVTYSGEWVMLFSY